MRSSLFFVTLASILLLFSPFVSAQDSENTTNPLKASSSCVAPECIATSDQTVYSNMHNILSLSLAAHHIHTPPLNTFISILNDTNTKFTVFIPNNEAVVKCRDGFIAIAGCSEGKTEGMHEWIKKDCETILKMKELDSKVEAATKKAQDGTEKSSNPPGKYNLFVDIKEYEAMEFSPVLTSYMQAEFSRLLVPFAFHSTDLPNNVSTIVPTLFNTTVEGMIALTTVKNATGSIDLLITKVASEGEAGQVYLPYARMNNAVNWTSIAVLPDIDSSNGVLFAIDTIMPIPFNLSATLHYNNYRGFRALLKYTKLLKLATASGELTAFVPTDEAFQSLLPSLPADSKFKPILTEALNNNQVVDKYELVLHQLNKIKKVMKMFKNPLKGTKKFYKKVTKVLEERIAVLNDPEMVYLTKLAGNHLLNSTLYSTNITNGMNLVMMSGESFNVTINPAEEKIWKAHATIGNANITWVDIFTKNGVLHEIDTVLLGEGEKQGKLTLKQGMEQNRPIEIHATINLP